MPGTVSFNPGVGKIRRPGYASNLTPPVGAVCRPRQYSFAAALIMFARARRAWRKPRRVRHGPRLPCLATLALSLIRFRSRCRASCPITGSRLALSSLRQNPLIVACRRSFKKWDVVLRRDLILLDFIFCLNKALIPTGWVSSRHGFPACHASIRLSYQTIHVRNVHYDIMPREPCCVRSGSLAGHQLGRALETRRTLRRQDLAKLRRAGFDAIARPKVAMLRSSGHVESFGAPHWPGRRPALSATFTPPGSIKAGVRVGLARAWLLETPLNLRVLTDACADENLESHGSIQLLRFSAVSVRDCMPRRSRRGRLDFDAEVDLSNGGPMLQAPQNHIWRRIFTRTRVGQRHAKGRADRAHFPHASSQRPIMPFFPSPRPWNRARDWGTM